jgi:hypothetical protein
MRASFHRVVIAACTLALVAHPLYAGKSSAITPSGGTAVKVKVGKNEVAYTSVGTSGRLRFTVKGPGRLTVMTRLLYPTKSKGPQRYAVVLREKGSVIKKQETQSDLSTKVTYVGSGIVPAKLRKFRFRVPSGTHTYEVALEKSGVPSVAVRLGFKPGKRPLKRVNLQAIASSRVATAVVREKLLTYYVSDRTKPAQLRVVGPTRLRISARLNFDASMKGRQKFAVGVWEGDKRIALKSLVTSKALAAVYQGWKEIVPGKAETFSVAVPSGEHRYTFKLEGTSARSVSLRFLIPQQDLKNER